MIMNNKLVLIEQKKRERKRRIINDRVIEKEREIFMQIYL